MWPLRCAAPRRAAGQALPLALHTALRLLPLLKVAGDRVVLQPQGIVRRPWLCMVFHSRASAQRACSCTWSPDG